MTHIMAKSRIFGLGLLSLVVALSVLIPRASANSCFGGPSNSALNQYCESIPSSSGGHGGSHGHSGGGGGSSSSGGPTSGGSTSGGSGSGSGTSSLASSLPRSVAQQLTGAAGAHGGSAGAGTTSSGGSSSGSGGHPSAASSGNGGRSTGSSADTRKLLSIPAPSVAPKSMHLQAAAAANVLGPFSWLLVVLAAVAVVLGGSALGLSRRSRST